MSKKGLVICMANYCRSPVAEILLNIRFKDYINFTSAGLIQFDKVGMDIRSSNFLIEKGINNFFHQPKKLTEKLLKDADIIYAMDIKILLELNFSYPNYSKKFSLFSLKDEKIIINDPYRLNDSEYVEIMKKIDYISSNILLDE